MARLTDLPEWDQRRHLDRILALPDFGPTPFVPGPPLGERRVAIVTTSGIHERGARPFEVGSADYRVIPGDTPPGDLVMSHISVNFDRTGFQEDVNVDLKAYYYEAVAAQPGNLAAQAIDHWFWHETAAAKVFIALRKMCLSSADPSLRPLGELVLVPRAIVHALVTPRPPAPSAPPALPA
jgi:D-proline reductase (dithiol) PrdB